MWESLRRLCGGETFSSVVIVMLQVRYQVFESLLPFRRMGFIALIDRYAL